MVTKRDGSKEEFNLNKIISAVERAFNSVNEEFTDRAKLAISSMDYSGCSTVEQIQDVIEQFLCKHYYNVGKSFILYREQHKLGRFIRERIDYMNKYSNSSLNASTSSETDSNANVSMKNVANLEGEVYKSTNRIIQRQRMKTKLKELYPEVADKYSEDLDNHIIYTHDEASTPVLKYYTYSCKEVVEVMYNSHKLLLPLDLLYSLVKDEEILVDSTNIVYQKTPWNLYIKDKNNSWTKVSKLTKKKRHRPLVRVKTAFGEDIVVTDNHPMIVDIENINNTIQAKDSLGEKQYRVGTEISFLGKKVLDMVSILPTWVSYGNTFIKYQQSALKRFIPIDRDLGYIVGFFIGDGGYNNTSKHLDFMQKDKAVLDDINDKIYSVFGIAGAINKSNALDKYTLALRNQYIYELFRGYFKIQDKAQNKTLPYNILEFNEEFAKGCLEGLIDADGTIKHEDCTINIRLSSRACILQCTYLFRYFGFSVGNGMQSLPFSDNSSYHTNYTIWGINATKREGSVELDKSFKVKENLTLTKCKSLKYKSAGYCNITSVDEIEKESSFYTQNEFIYDITTDTHTFCSNNLLVHNCCAVTLYPLMTDGVGNIDGVTPTPPNDIQSFSGQITNLAFLLSSQCKGAVAFGDYFVVLNYYIIKEFGNKWYDKLDVIVTNEHILKKHTIEYYILKGMKQFIYGVNQPAGNRSYNSPFTNVSWYDKYYFKAMFEDFYYPDGTQPEWKAIDKLQRMFMKLMRDIRLITPITFPVTTMSLLYNGKEFLDKDYENLCAEEWAKGGSFFCYMNDNPAALASCCRVLSEMTENTFSSTTGMNGVQTGSCNVITLNLNRIIQNWYKKLYNNRNHKLSISDKEDLKQYLINILNRVYKYHIAYKTMLYELEDKGMFAASNGNYIYMKKLYSTIGLIGYMEAAEFLGLEISNNKEYKDFLKFIFNIVSEQNKLNGIYNKKKPFLFNSEAIPGESLGVKLLKYDKDDGYWIPKEEKRYSCYFFNPWNDKVSIIDKLKLHGGDIAKAISGGQAAHLNLDAHLTKEQYKKLMHIAMENGTNYFTFNIPVSKCKDCNHVVNAPIKECPKCHSKNIKWYTRIIGYLVAVENWSEDMQKEFKDRYFSDFKHTGLE